MKTIPKDVAGTIARLQTEINELKGKLMIEDAKQETTLVKHYHDVTLEMSYMLDTDKGHLPMIPAELHDLFENPKLAECFQGINIRVKHATFSQVEEK